MHHARTLSAQVWPQAHQIDFIRPRRFDAIGRLEDIIDNGGDLATIRAMVHGGDQREQPRTQIDDGVRVALRGSDSKLVHTTRDLVPCARNIDLNTTQFATRICALFAVDYDCFGYSRPAECR